MLRHWIAAAAALIPAAAAQAQPIDWTGFSIGVNGALSRDRAGTSGNLQINQISGLFVNGRGIVIVPGTTRSFAASGRTGYLLGGAQLGYRWQSGNFVFGGEADFDPFERDVSAFIGQVLPQTALTPQVTIGAQRDVRIGREFTLRARAGYAFGRTLVYATGGYANARVRVDSFDSYNNPGGPATPCTPACQANLGPEGPVLTAASERHAMGGWTAGAGVDQAIGSHFSIGLELRHTDLGARDFALTGQTITNFGPETHGDNGGTGQLGSVSTGPTRVSLRNDAISLRLNFRF
jgi:opacity protein-like surface antigen